MSINYNVSGQDLIVAHDLKLITLNELRQLLGNLPPAKEEASE